MTSEYPRCRVCNEPLGVYEPVVVRAGSTTRETSMSAEPELQSAGAELFHRSCYPNGDRADVIGAE
jgi:hypothetical protein